MFTAISMAICLLVVFVYVVYKTRQINVSGSDGYFLAGRSLTGGVICATILLTNLSTEQLVGLSGQVYSSNMGPMAWEAPACIGAIGLAFIFLPHYFRQGVMTVPEFLETRCRRQKAGCFFAACHIFADIPADRTLFRRAGF